MNINSKRILSTIMWLQATGYVITYLVQQDCCKTLVSTIEFSQICHNEKVNFGHLVLFSNEKGNGAEVDTLTHCKALLCNTAAFK